MVLPGLHSFAGTLFRKQSQSTTENPVRQRRRPRTLGAEQCDHPVASTPNPIPHPSATEGQSATPTQGAQKCFAASLLTDVTCRPGRRPCALRHQGAKRDIVIGHGAGPSRSECGGPSRSELGLGNPTLPTIIATATEWSARTRLTTVAPAGQSVASFTTGGTRSRRPRRQIVPRDPHYTASPVRTTVAGPALPRLTQTCTARRRIAWTEGKR